eukprot:gene18819-34409_t
MVRESSKLKKKDKMTKKEMAYIREQNDKIHMMAENEQIPLAHGCKRPHIVLLSNKWQVTDMVLDPKTIRKFSDAIRETHPDDGNPIKLITFDWAMKAEDLLKKIEFAVKGTSKKLTPGDPEYFLKAKSFTFMVHHTTGSLFITKDMLTSMTTLSVPNQDNTRVRRWWSKIYDLLTCCGEDIVVGKVVGSRWNVEINCLGYTLDHTTYGETLEGVISTLLHCKVSATVDKQAYSKYFDMKKFKKAAQKMQNEKRSEAIGYDITNEDMTIRTRKMVDVDDQHLDLLWSVWRFQFAVALVGVLLFLIFGNPLSDDDGVESTIASYVEETTIGDRRRHAKMRLLAIVNPYGGGGKARVCYDTIFKPMCDALGVSVEMKETEASGHATILARDAAE